MKGPLFYSKILLFGEYGIIKDSRGLSIPYNFFKGALKTADPLKGAARESNENLRRFATYLETVSREFPDTGFDLDRLRDDLDAGLYFDSSIPQGYGVGSSGALVAAIYDRYARKEAMVTTDSARNVTPSPLTRGIGRTSRARAKCRRRSWRTSPRASSRRGVRE